MPVDTTGSELTFAILFPYFFLCFVWNSFFLYVLHEVSLRIPIPRENTRYLVEKPSSFFIHFSNISEPRQNEDGDYDDWKDRYLDMLDGLKVKIEEAFFTQYPFVYFNDTVSQEHKMTLSEGRKLKNMSWFQRISIFLRAFTMLTTVLSLCFWIGFWANLVVEFGLACLLHPGQGSVAGLIVMLPVLIVAGWFIGSFITAVKLTWYNTCDKYQMDFATLWRLTNSGLTLSFAAITAYNSATGSNLWHYLLFFQVIYGLIWGGLFVSVKIGLGLYTFFDLQRNIATRHKHLLLRREDAHVLTDYALWELLLIAQRKFKDNTKDELQLTVDGEIRSAHSIVATDLKPIMGAELIRCEDQDKLDDEKEKDDSQNEKEQRQKTASIVEQMGSEMAMNSEAIVSEENLQSRFEMTIKRSYVVFLWSIGLGSLIIASQFPVKFGSLWIFIFLVCVFYYLILILRNAKSNAVDELYTGTHDYAYDEHLKSINKDELRKEGVFVVNRCEYLYVPRWYKRRTLKTWRRMINDDRLRESVAKKLIQNVKKAGFTAAPNTKEATTTILPMPEDESDPIIGASSTTGTATATSAAVTTAGTSKNSSGDGESSEQPVISSSLMKSGENDEAGKSVIKEDPTGTKYDTSEKKEDEKIKEESFKNHNSDESRMDRQKKARQVRSKLKRQETSLTRKQLERARAAHRGRIERKKNHRRRKHALDGLIHSYFENDQLCVMRIPWAEHWAFVRKRKEEMNDEFGIKQFCKATKEGCALFIVVLLFAICIAAAAIGAESGNQGDLPKNYVDEVEAAFYPICGYTNELTQFTALDYIYLTEAAYYINTDPNDTFGIEFMLELWFGGEEAWTQHFLRDSLNITSKKPAFFYIKQRPKKVKGGTKDDQVFGELVAVRGTWIFSEVVEDISMFTEAAILQFASYIVPIETLLPTSFLRWFIFWSSVPELLLEPNVRQSFDDPVYQQVLSQLDNQQKDDDDNDGSTEGESGEDDSEDEVTEATSNSQRVIDLVGHSLGGAIAQIAGARLAEKEFKQITAFSLSGPGLQYSALKFGINPRRLAEIAVNVIPKRDVVGWVDEHTGLTQSIHCYANLAPQCHGTYPSFCEVYSNCPESLSRNTTFSDCVCTEGLTWQECAGLDPDYEDVEFWS